MLANELEREKIYFLPVCQTCPLDCNYCEDLGFLALKLRSKEDFCRSLEKAVSGHYTSVLLPCNVIFDFNFKEYVKLIRNYHLSPIVQVNTRSINQQVLKTIHSMSDRSCRFNFMIDESQDDLEKLAAIPGEHFFSLVIRKNIDLNRIVSSLHIEVLRKLYLYLPHKKKSFDGYFSCYQLFNMVEQYRADFPELKLKPIPGLDQYDPRISKDLELEPVLTPLLRNRISQVELDFSIVIPTYNNEAYIQNAIRHIANQDYAKEKFEIILVNDGSHDTTGEKIQAALEARPDINYKYLHFPRPRKREMGDAQFRAGIARNLGVKHAEGKYLSFLDADIITPPNYLQTLQQELGNFDVIQTERHYLKSNVSTNHTDYNDIHLPRDTFVPEKGYWHEFYALEKPWNELESGWKYVCTYSLTLSRELFQDIGWFKKTYMFYGFEDTDLGYRLFKAGKKFKLSDLKVLHLCQHDERSEYSNSDTLRQALLSKTAKIFYKNYLDREIYEQLKFLINDGPGLEDVVEKFFA